MPSDPITPDQFRALLAWAGLSQADAARMMGLAARSVQHWVAGDREASPTAVRLLRLWGALRRKGWTDAQIIIAMRSGPEKDG